MSKKESNPPPPPGAKPPPPPPPPPLKKFCPRCKEFNYRAKDLVSVCEDCSDELQSDYPHY